jgi:hypothetical protein
LDVIIWPALLTIFLLLFRRSLSALVLKATKVSYKDLELEFGKAVQSATEQAEAALPDIQQSKKASLLQRANHFPGSTIREAWREVDDVAENLVRLYEPDITLQSATRYKQLEDSLAHEGLLDSRQQTLFTELRLLRNKVAHAEEFEVSSLDAVQYVELCFRLIDFLKAQVPKLTA